MEPSETRDVMDDQDLADPRASVDVVDHKELVHSWEPQDQWDCLDHRVSGDKTVILVHRDVTVSKDLPVLQDPQAQPVPVASMDQMVKMAAKEQEVLQDSRATVATRELMVRPDQWASLEHQEFLARSALQVRTDHRVTVDHADLQALMERLDLLVLSEPVESPVLLVTVAQLAQLASRDMLDSLDHVEMQVHQVMMVPVVRAAHEDHVELRDLQEREEQQVRQATVDPTVSLEFRDKLVRTVTMDPQAQLDPQVAQEPQAQSSTRDQPTPTTHLPSVARPTILWVTCSVMMVQSTPRAR